MWIPAHQRWPNTSSAPVNTETQRATRLGRLRPVSHTDAGFSFHYVYKAKQTLLSLRTHQADASDAGLGHGTLAHLRRLLPEEEIQLVVVPLGAVGDEVHVDEGGVCGGEEAAVSG